MYKAPSSNFSYNTSAASFPENSTCGLKSPLQDFI
jgi:hypothetical protein